MVNINIKKGVIFMKKGLSSFILTGLSFIIVSYILPNMEIHGAFSLIVLTLFFGILNSLVKPVLQLLSLPITILSLGLFSFAINAIILKLAFMIVPGAHITGVFTTIIAALLISIVNSALEAIFKD